MRSPAEHKVSDVRTQVYQAAEVAMQAMQNFDPEIRALAIRQLVVDVEINSTALGMLRRHPEPSSPQKPAPNRGEHTVPEVAARCGVSIDAVKKWLRPGGGLQKTKAGGRTLIREEDLQDFFKRSTAKGRGRPREKAAA